MLPVPNVFEAQDKLIHAVVYALMAWLFWFVWKPALRARISLLAILAVVFCSAYGLSDEWHQSFVEGRDASIYDWLADSLGAFLLVLLLYKRASTAGQRLNSSFGGIE